MGNDYFSEKDRRLAKFMKAFGNPARIAVIRKLLDKNEYSYCTCGENCEGKNCNCGCKCGELVEMLPMSQSTVSQHIKELKAAEIINMNGRKGNYTLNHSKISEGLILLQDLLGKLNGIEMENKNCNCGPDCQCGDNCQCGPDCQCKSGGECSCGAECNCG